VNDNGIEIIYHRLLEPFSTAISSPSFSLAILHTLKKKKICYIILLHCFVYSKFFNLDKHVKGSLLFKVL